MIHVSVTANDPGVTSRNVRCLCGDVRCLCGDQVHTKNNLDLRHIHVKTPDDGRRNYPKHVEFHSKNKFENLVHLLGFILRSLKKCIYFYLHAVMYAR
jgi:hypothetical protein